jgi:glycosyltransferase involved in cell wall biosynthesis
MKVSGFSYVRNGLTYAYPFLEAIQSILPLCDEFIMVVGDSNDGTREAIEALKDPKVKIVDTTWDENSRKGGYIFSQQANIGLDHCTGDWCFHIQADEVIHEKDLPLIKQAMEDNVHNAEVEGFLIHFLNFFGDYKHIAPSRRYHNKEIRIVRNDKNIRSYLDSQGFRRFQQPQNYLKERGQKLHVKQLDATIYHYSYVKHPKDQVKKRVEFGKRWHPDDSSLQFYAEKNKEGYDYTSQIDILEQFNGTHPSIMKNKMASIDWKFDYDPSKNNMTIKEKFLYFIQKLTGKQLFAYKNYKIIRR